MVGKPFAVIVHEVCVHENCSILSVGKKPLKLLKSEKMSYTALAERDTTTGLDSKCFIKYYSFHHRAGAFCHSRKVSNSSFAT